MARVTVTVDPVVMPGLAGPTCVRAEATTYESSENRVERNVNQSHYARINCFDAAGVMLHPPDKPATLDSGLVTLGTAYRSGTLDGMLLNAFGP